MLFFVARNKIPAMLLFIFAARMLSPAPGRSSGPRARDAAGQGGGSGKNGRRLSLRETSRQRRRRNHAADAEQLEKSEGGKGDCIPGATLLADQQQSKRQHIKERNQSERKDKAANGYGEFSARELPALGVLRESGDHDVSISNQQAERGRGEKRERWNCRLSAEHQERHCQESLQSSCDENRHAQSCSPRQQNSHDAQVGSTRDHQQHGRGLKRALRRPFAHRSKGSGDNSFHHFRRCRWALHLGTVWGSDRHRLHETARVTLRCLSRLNAEMIPERPLQRLGDRAGGLVVHRAPAGRRTRPRRAAYPLRRGTRAGSALEERPCSTSSSPRLLVACQAACAFTGQPGQLTKPGALHFGSKLPVGSQRQRSHLRRYRWYTHW